MLHCGATAANAQLPNVGMRSSCYSPVAPGGNRTVTGFV